MVSQRLALSQIEAPMTELPRIVSPTRWKCSGYPTYEAAGWYIGSGAVESACKTVVGARLKGAGMRWGEPGSHAPCHVCAWYRSERGQWQAFWQRKVAA